MSTMKKINARKIIHGMNGVEFEFQRIRVATTLFSSMSSPLSTMPKDAQETRTWQHTKIGSKNLAP